MDIQTQRRNLVEMLFPDGWPRLWCPPLTHFLADGRIDAARVHRHLAVIAPYARGVLVPGSTGEGWDMSDAEVRELLAVVLDAARQLRLSVLIGVLRRDVSEMLAVIQGTTSWLCDCAGTSSGLAAMRAQGVVGFTVCGPSGAELTQDQIREGLATILELGHPTALYQLPQVTGNVMSPETVAQLAARYPRFFMLKDTSGEDRVAQAECDLAGVLLVRGAEGQYARWLKMVGGPYDGFLLSTANGVAQDLMAMIGCLDRGDRSQAEQRADRLEQVVSGCFGIVRDFRAANPFTNANKLLDHVMAYGHRSLAQSPPYLHGGKQLPAAFVEQAYRILAANELVPARGYLE